VPIPPLIERGQAAFRRDLPELLKTRYGQWVAYHGDQRLGFGWSKFQLVQECLRRGINDRELLVCGVAPPMSEEAEFLLP
jgi:hypothetical protein